MFPTVAKLYKEEPKDDNGTGKMLVCFENPTPPGKSSEKFAGGVRNWKFSAHENGGACLCEPSQENHRSATDDFHLLYAIVNGLKYKTELVTDHFTNSSMVIPNRQMEDFMRAVAMKDMALEQVEITEGDRVVVSEGEFRGMEGVVAKINGHRRFVITLSNLTAFALQIPLSYLKKIK
jgi:hypothetical protein